MYKPNGKNIITLNQLLNKFPVGTSGKKLIKKPKYKYNKIKLLLLIFFNTLLYTSLNKLIKDLK